MKLEQLARETGVKFIFGKKVVGVEHEGKNLKLKIKGNKKI